jgi:ABC-type amino acid transport substrate-binding protein
MHPLHTLALAGALVGGAAVAQAAAQSTTPHPPLRLCADPANLPFSNRTADGAEPGLPGLYVEIGQALAQALGRPLQTVWSLSYFGKRNLRSTLLAGQCDLAVGLPAGPGFMGPRLVYTRPFITLGYALVVPKALPVRNLDDLKGKRVAVQFGSPPQSLLALRNDITAVTAMDPEEAMRRLAEGTVDAAFIWGPSAGYINRTALRDAFKLVPVEAPHMLWQAAIGFSSKQAALRDEVDAALPGLAPHIRELQAKYGVAADPPAGTASPASTAAAPVAATHATPEVTTAAARSSTEGGDATAGKAVFDGTCAHCHGPNAVVADRKINLRLLQRKYGEQMGEVFFTTVVNGRPTKGMPAWKEVFKQEDFANILGYLKTVQER